MVLAFYLCLFFVLIVGILCSIMDIICKDVNVWLLSLWGVLSVLLTVLQWYSWISSTLYLVICLINLTDPFHRKKNYRLAGSYIPILMATMVLSGGVVVCLNGDYNSFGDFLNNFLYIIVGDTIILTIFSIIIIIPIIIPIIIVKMFLAYRAGNSVFKIKIPILPFLVIPMTAMPIIIGVLL